MSYEEHVHAFLSARAKSCKTIHTGEIFKLFFTTKSRNQGTGLGLCIADHIVTEMGGKITVNNHPGQGVAFCVSLPIESDWRLAGHDSLER